MIFRKTDADEPIENKDNFEAELPFLYKETCLSGFPISIIYLCDLNGDGYREICLTYYFKGMDDNVERGSSRIAVIDYINNTVYGLSDDYNYDFILGIIDDEVTVFKFEYETGKSISTEPLDMGNMKVLNGGDK